MKLSQHRQSKHKVHLINSRPKLKVSQVPLPCKRSPVMAQALFVAFGLKDGPLGSSLAQALATRGQRKPRKRLIPEVSSVVDTISVDTPAPKPRRRKLKETV